MLIDVAAEAILLALALGGLKLLQMWVGHS